MLEFLSQKFNDRESLSYMWKEIEDEARAADKLKVFGTVYGSSKFNCMVFKPNGNSSKASPRICLCDDCSSDHQTLAYEKQGHATTAHLVTKFKGYRHVKSHTPPTKQACGGMQ